MAPVATVSDASRADKRPSQPEQSSIKVTETLHPRGANMAGNTFHSKPAIGTSATRSSEHSVPTEELRKLMSGPVIQVFVGEPGRAHIAMEAAYVKLLTNFSLYCRRMLSSSGLSRIFVPYGTKDSITFIYRYMSAGGSVANITDSKGLKFRDLRVPDLLVLYGHAKYLEIESLKETVVRRLQWKLSHVFLLVGQIDYALRHVPEIRKAVVSSTARLFLSPKVLNYQPWIHYNALNKSFGKDVEQVVSVRRRQAQALTRRQKASKNKAAESGDHPAERSSSVEQQSNPQKTKHRISDATTSDAPKATCPRTQRRPNDRNTNRRSAKKPTDSVPDAPPKPVAPKHRVVHPKGESTRRSTQSEKANPNARPGRQPRRPRNHVQGGPRRELNTNLRIVEVVSNGEGITTSHREMRQGEMTRLSLVV